MTHTESTRISQELLEPGQFLGIHIGDSDSSKTINDSKVRTRDSEIWFFEVADVGDLTRDGYTLNDSTGSDRGPVGSSSGLDYEQLYDSGGNDILRNDEDDWIIYHFSIGVKQDKIKIYPRVPEGNNGGGFVYLGGSEPSPTNGDNLGFVPSEVTDYEDPSARLESIAWREGTRGIHQYGFYNEDAVQVDPLISIVGLAYQLRPVHEKDAMLNLLADMGKPQEEQDNRIKTVSFSKSTIETFSYDVPDAWKDVDNVITVRQANLPEEIEETLESESGGSNSDSGSGNGLGDIGEGLI